MLISPIITHQQDKTVIACADINTNFSLASKQNVQSLAVRQLLNWLQCRLNLTGRLIETAFPYHFFSQNNQQFFVCFSHSQNKVAVIISPKICAIDIETRVIKQSIAKHFFHADELMFLHKIPIKNQEFFCLVLWQFKENLVKLYGQTLIFWLRQNHSQILPYIKYGNNKQSIKLNFNVCQDHCQKDSCQQFFCHQDYQYSAIFST